MKKNQQKWILAPIMLAAGSMIIGVAAGVIPVDPDSVHAPGWLIGLIGFMFIGGGVALLVPEGSAVSRLAAAVIVLGMAFSAGWVALFGSGDHMSGGFWFLRHEVNVKIGRVVFGLGSLMCFAIAGWALFGKQRKGRSD